MPFFYDRISGLSGIKQYENYLDNQIYINQLKQFTRDPINYQLIEVRRAIGKSNNDIKETFNYTTEKVFGTLETGFNQIADKLENGFGQISGELGDINWRLNDLNEGLNNLYSMLDWKTDLLIEEQKITNVYLGHITNLLKIPDSQKQRAYFVEQGLTFLKNAIVEDYHSDFYSDALEEFLKARDIEPKDYFCLQKLGIIYLRSIKNADISKADEYFRASARYAKALANATTSSNVNNAQKKYNQNLDYTLSKETLIEEAAYSLYYASQCNYILNKLPEAIKLSKEAFELKPIAEYGYNFAKNLAANSEVIEAANILKKVIELDYSFVNKIFRDQDLNTQKAVLKMFESETHKLIEEVEKAFAYLRLIMNEKNPLFNEVINLQKEFYPKTYINARITKEKLFGDNSGNSLYEVISENHRVELYVSELKEERLKREKIAEKKNREASLKIQQNKLIILVVTLPISITLWIIGSQQLYTSFLIMKCIGLLIAILTIGSLYLNKSIFYAEAVVMWGVIIGGAFGVFEANQIAINNSAGNNERMEFFKTVDRVISMMIGVVIFAGIGLIVGYIFRILLTLKKSNE